MSNATPPIEQLTTQRGANQLQFFLDALTRHWKTIAALTIVASLGYGIWGLFEFRETPDYVATTTLGIVQSMWDQEFLQNVRTPKVVNLTAASLVRRLRDDPSWSEDVAHSLVQQDLAQGRAQGWRVTPPEYQDLASNLVGAIRFEPSTDSDTVLIRVKGIDPKEVERIANLTARVIVERNRQYILESEQDTYSFLQQQLEDLRGRLDTAESREWEFRKKMGFQTHEQVLGDMERLNQQLVQAETTKTEIFAKMEEIEGELSKKNDTLPSSLGQISDTVVTKLMKELQDLVQQQLEMKITYTSAYPGLKAIDEEIKEKQQAILVALDQLDSSTAGGADVWQDRLALHNQYRQMQLDVASWDIRIKTMKRLLNELVEKLPGLAEEL